MAESTSFVSDLTTALKREWWVVLLAVVVALAVGFAAASSTAKPTYVATGTVTLDSVTLGKYAPLMTSDRLLEALKSADFYAYTATKAGTEPSEVKSRVTITAANKTRDRLTVRVTGASKEDAQAFADTVTKAVTTYSAEKGTANEVARLESNIKLSEDSLAIAEAQKKRELASGNNPLALTQIEGQLNKYRSDIVNAKAQLTPLLVAYKVDGPIKVAEQSASDKLSKTLLGAGILGLFAGLALAALREFLIRRKQAA